MPGVHLAVAALEQGRDASPLIKAQGRDASPLVEARGLLSDAVTSNRTFGSHDSNDSRGSNASDSSKNIPRGINKARRLATRHSNSSFVSRTSRQNRTSKRLFGRDRFTQLSMRLRNARQVDGLKTEYELPTASTGSYRDKLTLAVVNVLGLGCCGVDRCVMGQPCCGTVKGLTLGALGIWAIIDYITIIISCLSKTPNLNALGFHADFDRSTVMPAFKVTLAFLIAQVVLLATCQLLSAMYRLRKMSQPSSQA